jgi:hypothetical protein
MNRVLFGALALALGLVGCRGNVLGTAELHGPGTAEAHFQSTGAPVFFWADTEGRWAGTKRSHFAAHYEIDITGGGHAIGHVSCDTKDSSESVCGTRVSDGATNHGDCEVKLTCAVPPVPAGPATLEVVATVGAGTSDVKKMSLNVRDK